MPTFEIISQIAIAVIGLASILLIAKKNRWGFVVGLTAQPFWFYTSYNNEQWGIFALCFAYTVVWIIGIREWFYKKPKGGLDA